MDNSYNELLNTHRLKDFDKRTKIPKGVVRYANIWNLQWKNELAMQRVYQIAFLLDREPDALDPRSDGMAWWKNPRSRSGFGHYYEFRIYDSDYAHSKPVRHSDFFYVALRRRLKPNTICHMQEITDSTYYYGVGGILYSTCGELEASMATFAIVIAYDNDEISLLEARERYNTYIKTIVGEFFENEKHSDMWRLNNWQFRTAIEKYIMENSNQQDIKKPVSPLSLMKESPKLSNFM